MTKQFRSAVRIFDEASRLPVGVGFLAGPSHVITCAHVVAAALGNPRLAEANTAPPGDIEIDFPALACPTGRETRQATVKGWQRLGGPVPDDVAVLVLDRPAPEIAEIVTTCTVATYNDRLLAYGVRSKLPDGAYIEARVLGLIPGPHIQVVSDNPDTVLRQGCSGAAAWSVDRGGVVGMCARGLLGSSALLIPINDIARVFTDVTGLNLARAAGAAPAPGLDFATAIGQRDAALAMLRRLALGPGLDAMSIPGEIIRAYAKSTDLFNAMDLIGDANRLVLDALPRPPDDVHAYIIERQVLPADSVAPQHFWHSVFANACMLGPRMVGALLLCAPPTVLQGARDAIVNLFLRLEN